MGMSERTQFFISYSSHDKIFVSRLVERLKASGVGLWLDEKDLRVGDDIRVGIERGIASCDFFGILLSRASAESRWVEKELSAAFIREVNENRPFVLPIRIEQSVIPPLIAAKRYADFSIDFDLGFEALLSVLSPVTTAFHRLGAYVVWNARRGVGTPTKCAKTLHYLIEVKDGPPTLFSAMLVGSGPRTMGAHVSDVAAEVLQTLIKHLFTVEPVARNVALFDQSCYFGLVDSAVKLEHSLNPYLRENEAGVRMALLLEQAGVGQLLSVGSMCGVARWSEQKQEVYVHRTSRSFHAVTRSMSSPLGFLTTLSPDHLELPLSLCANMSETLRHCKINVGRGGNHQ